MTCEPKRSPVPIIEFHGTDDTVIAYSESTRRGTTLPSIADWLSDWAARNGDDGKNTTWELFKKKVQVSSWENATVGYLIDGLGHDWPSTVANIDNEDGTYLNATSVILEFFANNTLSSASASGSASPSATASSSGTSTATPSATAKSAASSSLRDLFGWGHILLVLGFSLFFTFEGLF